MNHLVKSQELGMVSVVMPTYNCGRFIRESIESVLSQTYENWELLIQDDCSTDDTRTIVNSIGDSRIKYEINSKNEGAAVTRNAALRRAKGKWIAFLDSDDLWTPDKLEKQVLFMISNSIHFSYTNCYNIEENGNLLNIIETGPKKIGKFLMNIYDFVGCCTVMYDRDYVGLIQIENLRKRNDYALWLKVIDKAPCFLLDEPLAKYRIRKSGNLTTRGGIKKLKLLKSFYLMHRKANNANPAAAFFLTATNSVFYIFRRLFYVKKLA